jgi:hypothetical protein
VKHHIYGYYHGIREPISHNTQQTRREIKSKLLFLLPLRELQPHAVIVFSHRYTYIYIYIHYKISKLLFEFLMLLCKFIEDIKLIGDFTSKATIYFPHTNDSNPYSDSTVASLNTNIINNYLYENYRFDDDF